jgi:hypothetical protein
MCLDDADQYRERIASASRLTPALDLSAILVVAHRRRA